MTNGPDHAPRWWLERRHSWALWLLAGLMFAQGVYKLASGVQEAWINDEDIDLQMRAAEYELFRAGFYPHARVEMPPEGVDRRWTVYPPYALPMFAPFFEPGGIPQGRAVLLSLTLAALVFMGIQAFRLLRPAGLPVAAIGAMTAFAISGNKSAFVLGQFAILCVGLLMLQMHFVARNRPVLAGICWSLAMLKPHVALPFAVLFLLRRQWPGLLAGIATLATLSLGACLWTDNEFARVVGYWNEGRSMAFSVYGFGFGPGNLAVGLDVDHRTMQLAMLGAVGLVGVSVALLVRRLGAEALLPLAGLLGTAGMLGFYHRVYDQIMLVPMVLATIAWAVRSTRPAALAVAALALCSVLVPTRFLDEISLPVVLATAVWIVAGIYPLAAVVREERRRKAETS